MESIEYTLWADYCHYKSKTFSVKNKKVRPPKLTKPKQRLLRDMADWCQAMGADPRQWLYFLFKRRQWLYPPKFDRGNLLSKKLIVLFKQEPTDHYFSTYILKDREIRSKEAQHSLDSGTETMKLSYARTGRVEACMSDPTTKGYHHNSRVCGQCPLAARCQQQLQNKYPGIDLMRVRSGLLSYADAEVLRSQSQW